MEFGLYNKPEPLSLSGNVRDNWLKFKSEFEDLMIGNEWDQKSDKVKSAKLRNFIGPEGRQRIKALGLDKSEDYNELIKKLDEWAEPQKNVAIERLKFNSRTQNVGESFDEFSSDLKKLIIHCDYGSLRDEMLRDKIMMGVADQALKEYLFRMAEPTLEKVEKTCKAVEAAKTNVKLAAKSQEEVLVQAIHKNPEKEQRSESNQGKSNANNIRQQNNDVHANFQGNVNYIPNSDVRYNPNSSANFSSPNVYGVASYNPNNNVNYRYNNANYNPTNQQHFRPVEYPSFQNINVPGQSNQSQMSQYPSQMQMVQYQPRMPNSFTNVYRCKKCNRDHVRGQCPAHNQVCRRCGGLHHFARGCRVKPNVPATPKHQSNTDSIQKIVDAVNQDSDLVHYSPKDFHFSIDHMTVSVPDNALKTKFPCESPIVSKMNIAESPDKSLETFAISNNGRKEWRQVIQIEGIPVDFKLDPGSEVNTLPMSIFNKMKAKLESTGQTLRGIGHTIVKPLGVAELNAMTPWAKGQFPFFITKDEETKALLGIEACQSLDLVVRKLHSISVIDAQYRKFIYDNRDLFEGSGRMPGKLVLQINPNVQLDVLPPRHYPIKLSEKFVQKLESLEMRGIVEKVPPNEAILCVSNLLVREKEDGDLRLCLDPQNLNKCLVPRKFSLPTLEEIGAKLANKKWFTIFDQKEGFYHYELDEFSSRLCTFNTPIGLYRFKRLPFGINGGSEYAQERNTTAFKDVEDLLIFIDDFIIASKTEKEHDETITKFANVAKENGVKFKLAKFQYKKPSVKFVGFVWSGEGREIDPDRVRALYAIKDPTNKKELMSILGFINYVRDFVPNLSGDSAPLRELLKKDVNFAWNSYHAKILQEIKDKIAAASALCNFDPTKQITLQSDASKSGLGACLMADGKPVAYFSRALTETQRTSWGQIDKEFFAIVSALEKFYQYLYGNEVKVECDHMPIIHLVKKPIHKIKSNRLKNFCQRLYNFRIRIIFKPGRKMVIADLLSRQYLNDPVQDDPELDNYVHSLNIEELDTQNDLQEFQISTKDDAVLTHLREYLLNGWPDRKELWPDELKPFWKIKDSLYLSDNSIIYYDDKIVVPSNLRHKILALLHKGHFGITKTMMKANELYYWPGMATEIVNFLRACTVCEKFSPNNKKQKLLQIPLPENVFEVIGLDFAEIGKSYLILVDYLSKWMEILERSSHSAQSVITALKPIFATHGYPKIVICDNVPFDAAEFKKFISDHNGKVVTTSPCYPQAHGMIEVYVRIAKKIILKSLETKTDLYEMLLEYRNMPLASVNVSPAQILLSRRLRSNLPIDSRLLKPKILNYRTRMIENQVRVKELYDRHAPRAPQSFQNGQIVAIKQGKFWEKGTILNHADTPRSYWIKLNNGNVIRRNDFHIKVSSTSTPAHDQRHNLLFDPIEQDDLPEQPADNPQPPIIQQNLPIERPMRDRKLPVWMADYC